MQCNARVLLGEAVGLDAAHRFVELSDGERLPYDTLIVATGARHHYFGNDDWERRAPGLKSIEDATEMRRRILLAFERAEREPDADARRALLNFVIVGAGSTGVELAGAICELARDTLRHDFRAIDPRETRVLLVEGANRVLPVYPADLSAKARKSLERLGAEIRVDTLVKDLDENGVTLESAGQRERVPARCVLWAAGVRASSLARVLEKEAGASLDIANFSHQGNGPLPGVAPVAMQQGRYVARAIARRLQGREAEPFRYRDKGSMATIGRKAAVADFGRIRFSGFPAWLLWSGVHVFFLIEYENRVLVALRWLWNYVTRNRGTRLITGGTDVA
jgi:NADH dehydrogenase